jgi:hypothetical protein
MDVCLRLSVLCCPVSVESLRWTDPRPRSPLRKAKGPHKKDCRSQLEKKMLEIWSFDVTKLIFRKS